VTLATVTAPNARAESLTLNSTAAAACPSCTTVDGGGRVLDLFENTTQKMRSTYSPTYVGTAAQAETLAASIAGTSTGGATTATARAAGSFGDVVAKAGGFSSGVRSVLSSTVAGALLTANIYVWGKVGNMLFGGTVGTAATPPPGPASPIASYRVTTSAPGCWLGTPTSCVSGAQPAGYYLQYATEAAPSTYNFGYDTFLDGSRCAGTEPGIPAGFTRLDNRAQSSCTDGTTTYNGQTWGMRYLYYAPTLPGQTFPHVYGASGDPASPPTVTPPSTTVNRGTMQTVVQNALNADPNLAGAIESALTTGAAIAPADTFTMPNCAGQSVGWCQSSVTLAGGTSTFTETVLDWTQADTTKPAGAIVETEPAPDTLVPRDIALEAIRNPDFMPIRVPALYEGGGDPPPPPPEEGDGQDRCKQYRDWLAEQQDLLAETGVDPHTFWEGNWPPGANSNSEALDQAEECDPYYIEPGGIDYYRYLRRLAGLGLLGTMVVLAEDQIDPDVGPGGVVRVSPEPGTRRLPIVTPNPMVLLPPKTERDANPDARVTVYVNPSTAPAAPGSTAGGGVGPSPGSCDPWVKPNLNLDPLLHALDGASAVIPFGIPEWIVDSIDGLVADPVTPVWHMPFPWTDGVDVDLSILNPQMPAIRTVLLFGSMLGIGWFFFSVMTGGGSQRNPGGGDD